MLLPPLAQLARLAVLCVFLLYKIENFPHSPVQGGPFAGWHKAASGAHSA